MQIKDIKEDTTNDSICRNRKKYNKPERIEIQFPAKNVSNDYKLAELHIAIPDSFNNENDIDHPERWWMYHYYFGLDHLLDYDSKTGSIIQLPKQPLFYILNDSFFFDINGDGLIDFIHYPKYYKALAQDNDSYEIFIKQKNGYKILPFSGYIYDIKFNPDGRLAKFDTFLPHCCDDDHETFNHYHFDKINNELILDSKEIILTCQLIENK